MPDEEIKPKRPGNRRLARELALGLVYQRDLGGPAAEEGLEAFEANFNPAKDGEEGGLEMTAADFGRAWPLAREFFLGLSENLDRLDGDIARAALNWRLDRMSPVDRALIRLAYFEMLFREEIPPAVSIDEALEIAKKYGDDEAPAFINGVLNKLMEQAGPWPGPAGEGEHAAE